ncbi:DUF2809 domain-containing protein [Microbacterium sp. H1-D42]|uniref:ribosomal maturation YjgA family protein n=1 Tax=Microbacterium sp. H1-D42 TaxID=2925844 RepID=UPI001F536390|nr:DUF2809 domain-containing protein [Microbacterium sp. H1-D42]UNK69845.1 DUF2809 domain-containing protein [Microbacterium sp. H1-D42]
MASAQSLSEPDRRETRRVRRSVLALAAIGTVAAGLAVHLLAPAGIISDALGDVLYAVLIVLLVAFVAPRASWWVTGAAALVWCFGVELLQLSPLPAQWGAAFPPLRLVFGTAFSPGDLLWYAVGIALAAGILGMLRRARPRGEATQSEPSVSDAA